MMNRRQLGYLSWIAQVYVSREQILSWRKRPGSVVERPLTIRYVTNDDDSVRDIEILYRPNRKTKTILPCNFPHIRDVYNTLQAQGARLLVLGIRERSDIYVNPSTKGTMNNLGDSVIRICRWRHDQLEHTAETTHGVSIK